MNTVINILAIIVLAVVIIIAISGSRNLRRFYNGMDEKFDKAWKDADKYVERLKESENGNTDTKGELIAD